MFCPNHEHHLSLGDVARWWTPDPLVICTLVVASVVYARGVIALARRGHAVRRREIACYVGGVLSVAIALLSPLDKLSDILFSAHMGQHELLILVAPPLFVFARPFAVAPWAFGDAPREAFVAFAQRPVVRSVWRALTHPTVVVAAHAVVLWVWHVPSLFEAALADDNIHALQHLGFFVTAALFWWALIHGRYGRIGYGVAVLFVFVTAAHSSALGALLTVAGKTWYPTYEATGRTWGVGALDDQRLAGLLMWIPAGALFVPLALALFAAWLGESARRAARLDYGGRR